MCPLLLHSLALLVSFAQIDYNFSLHLITFFSFFILLFYFFANIFAATSHVFAPLFFTSYWPVPSLSFPTIAPSTETNFPSIITVFMTSYKLRAVILSRRPEHKPLR